MCVCVCVCVCCETVMELGRSNMAYEFSLLSELVCFALREERLLVHMLHSRNQRKASRQSSKSCLFFLIMHTI